MLADLESEGVEVCSDSRDYRATIGCVQLDVFNLSACDFSIEVDVDKGVDVLETLDHAHPLTTFDVFEISVYEVADVFGEFEVPQTFAVQGEASKAGEVCRRGLVAGPSDQGSCIGCRESPCQG